MAAVAPREEIAEHRLRHRLRNRLRRASRCEGSPASRGELQFDLWEGEPHVPQMYDWSPLRALISKHGLRNSLLVAPMPTASTSQILGVNECIEPYTSNLYARRVKAGGEEG